MRLAGSIAAILMAFVPAGAEELRIANWNIANLASGPGVPLRGYVRPEADYDAIADQIRILRPDIVALQEIGSLPAAQRILGEGWRIAFETRCMANARKCEADSDDIYTAIAWRDGLAERAAVFQVDGLAVNHTDECGVTRPVRGGVGVRLDIGGKPTWILSVHMKATCKDDRIEPGTEDDCATQKEQFRILKEWIDARPAGDATILAGDFNRKLLTAKDSVRNEIFGPLGDKVQFLPDARSRTCWRTHKFDFKALQEEARKNNPAFDAAGVRPRIYSPVNNFGIDFFVVINASPQWRLASDQVETDGLYRFEKPGPTITKCDGSILADGGQALTFGQAYPSDHCPLLLSITF